MPATTPPRAAYRTPHTPDADAIDRDALVEVIATWDDDAVLTVAHLGDGERFTVPTHLLPDGLGARAHALVTVRGDAVTVAPLDGPRFALQGAVTVPVGRVRFAVRRVPRGEAIAPPRRSRFAGATGAFALAFTALLGLAPRPAQPPWIARDDGAHRWIAEHARPRVARAYAPTHADTVGDDEGGNGRRAAGDEGRTGRSRAAERNRRWDRRPARPQTGVPTALADRVRGRGVFAALGARPAALAFMPDASAPMAQTGAMYGDAIGTSRGGDALGLVGIGFGGGGSGEGSIGLGALATRGHGDHTAVGQGLGGGGWGCGCMDGLNNRVGIGRGGLGRLAVRTGTPIVCNLSQPAAAVNLLDAASVRRVVRANLGQVRHCYEQALAANPSAEGTVTVQWVIDGDGAVRAAAVEESTVAVPSLGPCVQAAVLRWRFPAVADGASTVHYPFTFSRDDR